MLMKIVCITERRRTVHAVSRRGPASLFPLQSSDDVRVAAQSRWVGDGRATREPEGTADVLPEFGRSAHLPKQIRAELMGECRCSRGCTPKLAFSRRSVRLFYSSSPCQLIISFDEGQVAWSDLVGS